MKRAQRAAVALIALMLLVTAGPLAAGQAPQAPQAEQISGELIAVDTEKMMISVRTADEMTVEFSYTAETEIAGQQQGPAACLLDQSCRFPGV